MAGRAQGVLHPMRKPCSTSMNVGRDDRPWGLPWVLLLLAIIAGCTGSHPREFEPTRHGLQVTGTQTGDGQGRQGSQNFDAENCPRVESMLLQALNSAQPLADLEEMGYPTKDGRIQIVLTLAKPDLRFLEAWDVEIGSQAGAQVQVLAYPNDVCDIANNEHVSSIRLPSLAIPQ
jgi:hypothetical protein